MVLTRFDGKSHTLTRGPQMSSKTVEKTPADGIVQFAIPLRYPQEVLNEKKFESDWISPPVILDSH